LCPNLGRDRARRAARLEVAAEALEDLADATDVEAEAEAMACSGGTAGRRR
jgi:hypothetical protein